MTKEAKLTQKALANYKKKKQRYMKKNTIFGDEKIAVIDKATERRANLVASLLGNSKEARDIQSKFLQMVEVPQEDFDLNCFKLLTEELRNNVKKPDKFLQNQLRMNPKLTKKLTTIEDFVTIQPTTAESNHDYDETIARQDTLYESSITPSVEKFLALTDDPDRQPLAIKYTSKRQADRNIQTLNSNLNTSVHVEDQQEDENTFITNMVDSSYLSHQPPEGLPNIHQNRKGHNNGNLMVIDEKEGRNLTKQEQVTFLNEYQLIPVREKESNHDYHSSSIVAAEQIPTEESSSSFISRKMPLKKMAAHSSVLEMPQAYTRERLWREQSELSFTAGRRKVIRSTGNKRILGDKNGFQHSTLGAHLGRESRMLKQIKERVKNIEKKEANGSRLGKSLGVINIQQKIKRPRGTKTAGFRKYSVPLHPIFIEQDNKRKHSINSIDLEVNVRTQKNSQTLTSLDHNRLQTIVDQEIFGQEKTILSNIVVDTAGSAQLNDGYSVKRNQAKAQNTLTLGGGNTSSNENLRTAASQILQPWENENTLLGKQNPLQSSSQNLLNKARGEYVENTRIESNKVLNQYKNRRILVNNVQLSQLIRKDMNMFTGKEKKNKKKSKDSSNQRQNITVPSPKEMIKSTLLDESSSENLSNADINDLVQKPLGKQTPETLGSDHNNLNPKLGNQETLPGNLIYKSSREHFGLESESSNEILVKIQSKSNASIGGLPVNNSGIALNTQTEFGDRRKRDANNSSFLSSQAHLSSKDQSRDRQDRISKEIHEYYRIINSDKLDAKKKLANVVIRGKNILEPNQVYLKHRSIKNDGKSHFEGSEPMFDSKQKIYLEQVDKNQQTPTPEVKIHSDNLYETSGEGNRRENQNRGNVPNKILVGSTQKRLVDINVNSPIRASQTIIKSQALQIFANEKGRLTHSLIENQKKNEHEVSFNNSGFSNQQRQQQRVDSHNETGYNDPYGTHNQGKFQAIYEIQDREEQSRKIPRVKQQQQRSAQHFQKEPNVSSKKEKDFDINKYSFDKENGYVAHKINITGPFFPNVNSKGIGKRTSSVSDIKKGSLRKEREQSPNHFHSGQVHLQPNTRGHSEEGSFGTLEERRDSAHVSSVNQTPIPPNHLGLVNLNTNFDFQGNRKLSKPSKYHRQTKSPTQDMVKLDVQYRDTPTQAQGQLVSTRQNSENDKKQVEETFDKGYSKKGKFSLSQTKQTLHHRSIGKSSNSLEPSVLPIIKIRMVLASDHSRKSSQEIYREPANNLIQSQKLDVKINEVHQEASGVTVTEPEEPPMLVSVKQLSKRPAQSSSNRPSHRKASQKANGNNEANENSDLLPVIKSDVNQTQRDSATQS